MLFILKSQYYDHSFELNDDNQKIIKEKCKYLHGLIKMMKSCDSHICDVFIGNIFPFIFCDLFDLKKKPLNH